MIAQLTFFKPSGKFYTTDEVEVDGAKMLGDIFEELARDHHRIPDMGLLIEVPDHRHAHPHFVYPVVRE